MQVQRKDALKWNFMKIEFETNTIIVEPQYLNVKDAEHD